MKKQKDPSYKDEIQRLENEGGPVLNDPPDETWIEKLVKKIKEIFNLTRNDSNYH